VADFRVQGILDAPQVSVDAIFAIFDCASIIFASLQKKEPKAELTVREIMCSKAQ
jgi:hypothetical protein